MRLITNPGNFQTIKILIAAKTSGIHLQITEVKHYEKVVPYLSENKLPILEVQPEKYIFCVNSAVRLLFTSTDRESNIQEVDEWLEWESSQLLPRLLPLIISHIVHCKTDKQLESLVRPVLTHLNTNIQKKNYIVEDKLSSADITIFGTIYPLLSTPLFEAFPDILSWSQKLLSLPSFEYAVSVVTKDQGLSAFKECLLNQPTLPSADADTSSLRHKHGVYKPSVSSQSVDIEVDKQVTPEEISAAISAWEIGAGAAVELKERKHPILPRDGERNLLIASALPYVNNVPHLGNIIGCVLSADVFSRYCRLRNYNCLYICGTDEYGTATENKALEEGLTPQQICDKYNKLHAEIYDWFNISFDYFGRTTTQQQTEIVQDIFWKVYDHGYVIKDSIDQLHCEKCNRFLADRFVSGKCPMCAFDDARGDQCDGCSKLINAVELINPKCKSCSSTPTVKTTQHLFLDLPKVEAQLQNHLDKVFESSTWTHNAKVITKSWLRDGLKPRCITRDLKWGIPVPLQGYTDKVFYVWFDAPIGYLSITAAYTNEWEKWWKNPQKVELYNFLGKDNVPFHSVIFPCTLLGTHDNFTLVNHMIATEYLNYEDTKFSKSRGTGVFGNNAKETGISADVFRFYLLYVRPESQDSAFSWDDFLLKNNSELLNNIGNFINRGLSFVSSSFDGIIQEITLTQEDIQTVALINRELKTYIQNMEQVKLRDSIRNILSISRLGNQMMQCNTPWVLVKGSPEERNRAGSVVSLAANISCLLSVLLQPYMPATSDIIQSQLNSPKQLMVIRQQFVCVLKPGHKIGKPSPLFQKIETSLISDLKKQFHGKPSKEVAPVKTSNQGLSKASDAEIASLTEQVTKQGELVRELKGKKAEKSQIDSEVSKLLDLKKQLSFSQGINQTTTASSNKKKNQGKQSTEKTAPVKVETSNQGLSKASGAEIASLTEQVTKQGELVRELKGKKAEKSQIDSEVTKLLDLKKQLSFSQGIDPTTTASSNKKKGKNK